LRSSVGFFSRKHTIHQAVKENVVGRRESTQSRIDILQRHAINVVNIVRLANSVALVAKD
jgi:hypothetical protein